QFAFTGVPAGRYRLSIVQPAALDRWFLKSSVARGRDALDAAVDVRPGEDIADWVLTYSDRPTELSGTLQDASGRPAPDDFVLVFPADRAYWTPFARRVRE